MASDQRGTGPDVLLIAGLSDPAEGWTFSAFDNRGAGRSPMPPDGFSSLLASLDISNVHVCGFSGGSATPQELALRHP